MSVFYSFFAENVTEMNRTLLIYDEIGEWGTNSKDVAQFLIDNEGEEIDIRINSPGGSVFDAYAIYNNIRNTKNVTIYIDGIAASAAAIIALCGKPLKMAKNSMLMLHSASAGAWGNRKEMEEKTAFLDQIDTTLASMIAAKMGKTVEDVKALYFDGTDHWLDSQQCKDMGLCEIWEPSAEDRVNLQKVTACLRYTNINTKTNHNMLKRFQAVDAFKGCNTEDDVFGKVNDLIAENGQKTARIAELEATEQKYKDLVAQLAKEQKEADDKLIADAINDGRMPADMKGVYEEMMAKDRENTIKVIGSLAKPEPKAKEVKKVADYIKEEGANVTLDSWEEKRKQIAERNKR